MVSHWPSLRTQDDPVATAMIVDVLSYLPADVEFVVYAVIVSIVAGATPLRTRLFMIGHFSIPTAFLLLK
jgi:hypothetical protein